MKKAAILKGSGNVYQDIGMKNPVEMQTKAILVSRMLAIIKKKKWTQKETAAILQIPQPKVSRLSRGHFAGFSLEKLIHFLNILNQDVEIVIKNRPVSRKKILGQVSVFISP